MVEMLPFEARGEDRQHLKDQPVPVTTEQAHQELPERVATGKSLDSIPGSQRPAEANDVFVKMERLGDLNKKGIISDAEFAAKTRELIDRL
jgi:hypothetical protein